MAEQDTTRDVEAAFRAGFAAGCEHVAAAEISVTDAMVEKACAAFEGEDWRSFDASLVWPMRKALEAVLADGRRVRA